MKRVSLKVGKMRKADECVVYPESFKTTEENDDIRFVQGERLVLLVDMTTGKAKANYKTGSTYPTSWHLINHPNIELITLSPEQVEAIRQATPKSGQRIGGGVYLA